MKMTAKTIEEYNERNLQHVSCVIARYNLTDEEWEATPERLQIALLEECAERDD